MRTAAVAIVVMLLLASNGCAALLDPLKTTCYGTLHRDTLVSSATALSEATGGEVPTLAESDCDGWSAEIITYPGVTKEDVAARMTRLPYCTAHVRRIDTTTTRTWWECNYSGSMVTADLDSEHTPVRVWVGAH